MDSTTSLAPHNFCFKREKFVQPNFSVDVFLQDLFNITSLDNLRDDLGMYLKVLRSAMIELINEDYADFVNLSGNLIGLDKAIVNIQDELLLVLSTIKLVDVSINETFQKMLITMLENQNLEEATILIEYLRSIPIILAHLENHVASIKAQEHELNDNYQSGPKHISCVHTRSLKRASDRHNSLQYLCFQCLNTKISSSELRERVKEAEENLMASLQSSFLRTFEQSDIPSLSHIITIYSSLDKFSLMENLLHLQIIAPTFKSIFNPSQLSMDPFDLCGLMGKAKLFVTSKLLPIIEIFKSWSTPVDVVRSCIFPEFTTTLENQLRVVFSHKDPDLFHKRFKCTMDFLEFLESIANSKGNLSFKNNVHYLHLLSLWNLPVYFQIRYQDIAGAFESCLLRPSLKSSLPNGAHHFRTTDVLLTVLAKCFDPALYLDQLAYRFWKLFLQILSRHQLFYSTLLSKQLHAFDAQPWMQQVLSSESPKFSLKVNQQDDSFINTALDLGELVHLYLDIRAVAFELPKFLNSAVLSHSSMEDKLHLEEALLTSGSYYEDTLMPIIGHLISCELVSSSVVHMRSVSDIPRLYRRTNKEAPTKCSAYVRSMLAGLEKFYEANVEKGDFVRSCLESAIRAISQQYHTAISSVLTSVLKTEESLKRLRKDRFSMVPQGSSDDEKIRLQLAIDVAAFVELVQQMNTGDLNEIRALRDLVAEHTKQGSPSE